MKTHQRTWTPNRGWNAPAVTEWSDLADLVLVFGSRDQFSDGKAIQELKNEYARAQIVGCSTAGAIAGTKISDDFLVLTAICFQQTQVRTAQAELSETLNSSSSGRQLAEKLVSDDLAHVLVFSDGLHVNGAQLVTGISEALPPAVAVTGGLAGDGDHFAKTLVYCNGELSPRKVVAVGFYGKHLRVGYGSLGGWDPFGPLRTVTRSKANVLYELDGESALGLYKRYLGRFASGLPATGLRFPLSIQLPSAEPIVRTILGINEIDQSLTFAGDIPEGAHARLMRTNLNRLIDGATSAAQATQTASPTNKAELALLVSCVGRKLVLQQRIEEEVEAVRAVLGPTPAITGFYSYGEIAPFTQSTRCQLHNQTMTVTTFSEAA